MNPDALEDKAVHVVYKAPAGYSGKILIGDREKKKYLNMPLNWFKLMYKHYNDTMNLTLKK
jgi:hypothetical protein